MLIKGQLGRALVYSEGTQCSKFSTLTKILDQIGQLANELATNQKLSDSAPISLCPQVSMNFDDVKKQLTSVEIKVRTIFFYL